MIQAKDFDSVIMQYSADIKDHGYVTYDINQLSAYPISYEESHSTVILDSSGR